MGRTHVEFLACFSATSAGCTFRPPNCGTSGRVLIPKTLRTELHLGPGDSLQLESEGEEITLRPVRPKALLKKEQGVWVYQGEATHASIHDLIDREREKRSRELTG